MIGISTTYFALQGFDIYGAVAEASGMGFGLAEFGATHGFEKGILETLKRIRRDFPGMKFTLHGLFPPLKQKFWFNPAEGLTAKNKKIVESFFSAAQIVEAELVSFHPGFSHSVLGGEDRNGLNYPEYGKEIPRKNAFGNAFNVLALAQKLSEKTGIGFAVENTPAKGKDKPLFVLAKDFQSAFERFENCGLLLDFGHALFSSNLQEMLSMRGKISQVHVHLSMPRFDGNLEDNHMPITSLQQLEQLSCIKQLGNIPLVFEHGKNVSRQELLLEKGLLESFLKNQGACN